MNAKKNTTSAKVASKASTILKDKRSGSEAKSVAGSALCQKVGNFNLKDVLRY